MEIERSLSSAFPGLQVLELELKGLSIKGFDPALEKFKKEIQEKVRNSIKSADEIKERPILRAYRDFFWRVGIDPTKQRPSGEALIRRVFSGRDIPIINTLVDSYNLASVETSIAIAAFDVDKISQALLMRKAHPSESFLGIGMETSISLRGVEVVIEDRKSATLIANYPYRDSNASKVTQETKSALLLMCGVPRIETSELENARQVTKRYLEKFCQ